MGEYDIPAVVDFILEETRQKKLAYIGHSQGSTQMFYALATNQDFFKDKVSVFIALGPALYLRSESSFFLNIFRKNVELIMQWSKAFGIFDIM